MTDYGPELNPTVHRTPTRMLALDTISVKGWVDTHALVSRTSEMNIRLHRTYQTIPISQIVNRE